MKTPLLNVQIPSIYTKGNQPALLPARMAKCTPDMYHALHSIATDLQEKGGKLVLSDMFRSYDMQYQANLDYRSGKKAAYSPPPGGSMHEAGRAIDIDLSQIKVSLAEFWAISQKYGATPIISQPNAGLKEAWHFDCRGSHGLIYEYYKNGKGSNMKPYTAMAVSSILSLGIMVDRFGNHCNEAFIQSGLIRLGFDIGDIDGYIGANTNAALKKAGITSSSVEDIIKQIEDMLQAKFPIEYQAVIDEGIDEVIPEHIMG
ncbi:MAG: D-alanyl-D-alanine carboxypeptidase family protein [Bacteroidota bacterium]|nr:D-alanyl-D-alanine carboxypeptidase family protein [Bacteroidota bacterium]